MGKTKQIEKPGRPKIDLSDAFTKLQPFLQLGYSLHRACIFAEYPYSSLIIYYNDDEVFRNKVERERKLLGVQARRNIAEAIKKKDPKMSLEWLERQEPEEFSKISKVENITPEQDEGVILLREIIRERRISVKIPKQIKGDE